ncbi:hypothetical protein RND81_10G192400 [Saponaria officinalis]|uniref:Uncharacterized protein n=1 Tax=Saponaria officinalis TaxID=3572 RepID=A0AAW1I6L7_SAPOF
MCSHYSLLSISGMSNSSDDQKNDLITCELILTNQNCKFPPLFTDDNTAKGFGLRNIVTTTTTTTTTTDQDQEDWPTTPTSLDQRIPEIGPCPPAPRRPIIRKRKHSPEFGGTSRLLDFSKEIESMYPPHLKANLGRKIKKARSV